MPFRRQNFSTNVPKFSRRPQRTLFTSKDRKQWRSGRFAAFRTTRQEKSCLTTKVLQKSKRPSRVLDHVRDRKRFSASTYSLVPIVRVRRRATHDTTTTTRKYNNSTTTFTRVQKFARCGASSSMLIGQRQPARASRCTLPKIVQRIVIVESETENFFVIRFLIVVCARCSLR